MVGNNFVLWDAVLELQYHRICIYARSIDESVILKESICRFHTSLCDYMARSPKTPDRVD